MKKSVIIRLIVVVLLATVVTAGCGNDKEGQLPTLKVGDQWSL